MTTLIRLWDKATVAAELRDALDVVEELDPPDDLRLAVFNSAASSLLHRVMQQPPPNVTLPAMAIPRQRAGH